ncbi:uncharacterized protein RBU47_003543 [Passerculus sandwichensis]
MAGPGRVRGARGPWLAPGRALTAASRPQGRRRRPGRSGTVWARCWGALQAQTRSRDPRECPSWSGCRRRRKKALELPQHRTRKRRFHSIHRRRPVRSGCARSLPDAALERTKEKERTHGCFRRTAQMVVKFMKRIREEETSIMGTVVRVYPPIFKTKSSAALLDMLVEEGPSSPKQESSLWPGFDPPSNCLTSQATPAAHCARHGQVHPPVVRSK